MLIQYLHQQNTFPLVHLDDLRTLDKRLRTYFQLKRLTPQPSDKIDWPLDIQALHELYRTMQNWMIETNPMKPISVMVLLEAMETQHPESHLHQILLWSNILDLMLQHEEAPIHLSNFFGTEVSTPIQFAAWITYLAKNHDASQIISCGLLQRYFERCCSFDLAQINAAYTLIAQLLQSHLSLGIKRTLTELTTSLAYQRTAVGGFENYSLLGKTVDYVVHITSNATPEKHVITRMQQALPNYNYYIWNGKKLLFISDQNEQHIIQLNHVSITQDFLASCPSFTDSTGQFTILSYHQLNTYVCKNSSHKPPLQPLAPDAQLALQITPNTQNIESLFQLFGPSILSAVIVSNPEPNPALQQTLTAMLEQQCTSEDLLNCYATCAAKSYKSIYLVGSLLSPLKVETLFHMSLKKPHLVSPWIILVSSEHLSELLNTRSRLQKAFKKLLHNTPITPASVVGIILLCQKFSDGELLQLATRVFNYYFNNPHLLLDTDPSYPSEDSERSFTQYLDPEQISEWLESYAHIRYQAHQEFVKIYNTLLALITNVTPLTQDKLIDITTYYHQHTRKIAFLCPDFKLSHYPQNDYQLYHLILEHGAQQQDFDLSFYLTMFCPLVKFERYPNPSLEHQCEQARILFEYMDNGNHTPHARLKNQIQSILATLILNAPLCLSLDVTASPAAKNIVILIIQTQTPQYIAKIIKSCIEQPHDTRSSFALKRIKRYLHPSQIDEQIELGLISSWTLLEVFGYKQHYNLEHWPKKRFSQWVKRLKQTSPDHTDRIQALSLSMTSELSACTNEIYQSVFHQYIHGEVPLEQGTQVFNLLKVYPATSLEWSFNHIYTHHNLLLSRIQSEYPLSVEGLARLDHFHQKEYESIARTKEFRSDSSPTSYPTTSRELVQLIYTVHIKQATFQLHDFLNALQAIPNINNIDILINLIQYLDLEKKSSRVIYQLFIQKNHKGDTPLHLLPIQHASCIAIVLKCISKNRRVSLLLQSNQQDQTLWEQCLRLGLFNPVYKEIAATLTLSQQYKLQQHLTTKRSNSLQQAYASHGFLGKRKHDKDTERGYASDNARKKVPHDTSKDSLPRPH